MSHLDTLSSCVGAYESSLCKRKSGSLFIADDSLSVLLRSGSMEMRGASVEFDLEVETPGKRLKKSA